MTRLVLHRCTALWLVAAIALTVALPAYADDPRQQALELSKDALNAYLAGEFARAERLYGEAYRLAPQEHLYLYNAARAAERAGHLDAAERMYDDYLRRADPGQAEVAKARHHLAELRAAHQPLPEPRKPPPKQPGAGRGAAGLGLLITGGVVAVGGGVLLGTAAGDQSELNARLAQVDAKGNIIGISHGDAVARQSRINTSEYIGWAMLGVGAAAAVAGGVLMGTAPDQRVSVGPGPGGVGLQVALRF